MKKTLISLSCFILSLGIFIIGANATTIATDASNNITTPSKLSVSENSGFTVTGIDGTLVNSYQLVDVTSDSSIKDAIVSYLDLKADSTATTSALDAAKANLKTNIADYNDANWQALSENVIPSNAIESNKYYVLWLKVSNGTTTIYDFDGYSTVTVAAAADDSSTDNPDTGIVDTLLYVGVGALIVVGSALVINKNKEIYG